MSDRPDEKGAYGELIADGESNAITEVVVFTDQAYIRRRAQAKASVGLNRFLVEVRAFAVDADSAQAGVKGEGVILSVQYKEVPVRKALQEEVRELDGRMEELTREREALLRDREVLDKQGRFLDSVIDFGEVEVPKEVKTHFPDAGDLKTMLDFLGENFRKLSGQDGDLAEKMKKLDEEIEVVERKRRQIQGPRRASRKVIEVLFDSKEDQDVGIEVSYGAAKATWEPVYKVDVPLEVSRVDLTMFARIRQRTGENWSGVRLSISNAVPLKGEALPDLERWDLTLTPKYFPPAAKAMLREEAAPVGKKGRIEAPGDADMLMDLDEPALVGGPPEAEFAQAEQKELPLAFEYELLQEVGIDSGGGETLLPLYTKRMDGDFFIHAVPSKDPLAYLVCRTARDSELLAGRLNIHFGVHKANAHGRLLRRIRSSQRP